jgi:hypothetical protein
MFYVHTEYPYLLYKEFKYLLGSFLLLRVNAVSDLGRSFRRDETIKARCLSCLVLVSPRSRALSWCYKFRFMHPFFVFL